MKQTNFKDPKTDEEFFFPKFRTSIVDGQSVYKDRWGKEILNKETGTRLVLIEEEGVEITVPMLGRYSGKSPEGQENVRKHFQKRAHKFDTVGAGGNEKYEKEKAFKDQVMDRAKKGLL